MNLNREKNGKNYLWRVFLKNVEKSKLEKQLANFLNNLLSETEKKNIVRRLTVIFLLK